MFSATYQNCFDQEHVLGSIERFGIPIYSDRGRGGKISLLPAISKVLEKIIALQLSSYFEKNKLLFDNQYGFRPKHCTEHAALELIDRIINKMDINEIPLNIFSRSFKSF